MKSVTFDYSNYADARSQITAWLHDNDPVNIGFPPIPEGAPVGAYWCFDRVMNTVLRNADGSLVFGFMENGVFMFSTETKDKEEAEQIDEETP